jgi:hypothetical protein
VAIGRPPLNTPEIRTRLVNTVPREVKQKQRRPGPYSTANPPDWFLKILGTYAPDLERTHPAEIKSINKLIGDQKECELCLLKNKAREAWLRDSQEIWRIISSLGLHWLHFSSLVSQAWDDGYARVVARANASDGVSGREKTQRQEARQLAAEARFLAEGIERILQGPERKTTSEIDKDYRMWLFLWSALYEVEYEPGKGATGSHARFPGITTTLREFADAIDQSLKSTRGDEDVSLETQAKILSRMRDDAFEGRDAAGRSHKSIVTLLTDPSGMVRYSAWRRLLKMLHPELRQLKLTNRDLKAESTARILKANSRIPPTGGNRVRR